MGIVLFVVRKWSDCAILVTAILFLLQPVEWYHYIVGLFDPSHTLPDWGVGAMYKEVAEYTKEGNLWEFLGKNMTFGQKASLYWALGAGRFWQTAGLFLMGLYIGRKQLLLLPKNILVLGEGSYHFRYLFCSAFPTERVDYG